MGRDIEEGKHKRQRISESYPPTSIRNFNYSAEVHEKLKYLDLNSIDLDEDISFRSIDSQSDVDQLRDLHKEWFPIPYEDSFFTELRRGNGSKSILAELDMSKQFGFPTYFIVGAVIYVSKSASFSELRFKFSEIFADTQCLYVQTLGVVNELRQCGLATQLLNKVKEEASKNYKIKYISLHMVEYNTSGERFYKKNGFIVSKICSSFYQIEQKTYDSYLFIYYLSPASKPYESYFVCIKSICSTVFSKLSKTKRIEEDEIKII